MKNWYLAEAKQLKVDVSWNKIDSFLTQLCHDAGLDSEGMMPLTKNSLDWSQFSEPEEDQSAKDD